MDQSARLIANATPLLSKQLSWKYAHLPGGQVAADLKENHGRPLSKKLVWLQNQRIGDIMSDKEVKWHYRLPDLGQQVSYLGISLDGTTSPIIGEGFKETMTGTVSFYDASGDRLYTTYKACAPQQGKKTFLELFSDEIQRVKAHYPDVLYTGIADGAASNWRFLEPRVDRTILDYFHATEYLSQFAGAAFGDSKKGQETWLCSSKARLKNEPEGAHQLLKVMQEMGGGHFSTEKKADMQKAIVYFGNHKEKMAYAQYQQENLPIGSGVVEAACKTFVKQRISQSGMKWRREGIDTVLMARELIFTQGRWNQFWNKMMRYGC